MVSGIRKNTFSGGRAEVDVPIHHEPPLSGGNVRVNIITSSTSQYSRLVVFKYPPSNHEADRVLEVRCFIGEAPGLESAARPARKRTAGPSARRLFGCWKWGGWSDWDRAAVLLFLLVPLWGCFKGNWGKPINFEVAGPCLTDLYCRALC